MAENYIIHMVCPTCRKQKDAQTSKRPTFSFELTELANQNGWYGVNDIRNCRSLLFCSRACYEKQLTTKGQLRKRLIVS